MTKSLDVPVRDERTEGATWSPKVGGRVTLLYPEEWNLQTKNFPVLRVGMIFRVESDGCFHVSTQPANHSIFVDPNNYAQHGASYRGWKVKDGWPLVPVIKKKK